MKVVINDEMGSMSQRILRQCPGGTEKNQEDVQSGYV
jgi:hypothetical protein